MSDESAKREWVRRVLGFSYVGPEGADDAPAALPPSFQSLEPDYLSALRAAPDQHTVLVAAWEHAITQSRAGTEEPSLRALTERIEAVLAAPAKADTEKFGTRKGIVAERRAELEAYFASQITSVKSRTVNDIASLTESLGEVIEEPKHLVDAVRADIARQFDTLQAGLLAAVASGDEDEVGDIMADWYERAEASPVLIALQEVCDASDVDIPVGALIEKLMADILKKIETAAA